jgi:hypothetical protein
VSPYGYFPLIASNARTARGQLGPCQVCHWALLPGDRVCDLAAGQGVIHVAGCSAQAGSR